jgi:hypothetical protein
MNKKQREYEVFPDLAGKLRNVPHSEVKGGLRRDIAMNSSSLESRR